MSVRRLPTLAAGPGLPALTWPAACNGAASGAAWFVSTTGERLISGTRDWYVASRERAARLMPQLTIVCYENFPLRRWEAAAASRRSSGRTDPTRSPAATGRRELVRCGSGRDRARLDRRDRARSCERISRPG